MSAEIRKQEMFYVDMKCDRCGTGYMRYTGIYMHSSLGVQPFHHQCTYCGHQQSYSRIYPTIMMDKEVKDE